MQVREQRGRLAVADLFEHHLIGLQTQQIADELDGDLFVAAELQCLGCPRMRRRQGRPELDIPPVATTAVETVTITARALSVPIAVSRTTDRSPQSMSFTGVKKLIGRPSASLPIRVPVPLSRKGELARGRPMGRIPWPKVF